MTSRKYSSALLYAGFMGTLFAIPGGIVGGVGGAIIGAVTSGGDLERTLALGYCGTVAGGAITGIFVGAGTAMEALYEDDKGDL